MKLFDIVFFEAKAGMARKLGFTKLLTVGSEVLPRHSLLVADNQAQLFKSANDPRIRIIVIGKGMLNGNVVGRMANLQKPIAIDANKVVTQDRKHTIANINDIKRAFSKTRTSGISIGIASLAKDENEVFSSLQLIELAKLLGIGERMERQTLSALGDALD